MKSSEPATRYSPDMTLIKDTREPFGDLVQQISQLVCKYRNNFSVQTDGTMTKEGTEQVQKVTLKIEIFTR